MPHLFVDRRRLHHLTASDADFKAQFRWETINAVVYKLGGLIFVIGSILFFPALSAYADLGAWVFIFGSLLYLLVTGHDMAEVVEHRRQLSRPPGLFDTMEFIAAATYLAGTLCFTVGSVFFLSAVGLFHAGAWLFVIGSLLFVAGATVNVVQIITVRNRITMQLMNYTAVSFVAGSLLFAVASVPYLFDFRSPADERVVETFLAWQYVIGSSLFLLGGITNYWRAYRSVRRQIRTARLTAD